ncbi:MAG: protoheme IX farnesyltransferase [Alphaproteobacteria bacterium]|nr:protoheme IX farnesyltransferase [Alphaproteobacteria bacterium]
MNAAVRDYAALLKPRVMSLVVFSGLAGVVIAPGHMHPVLAAVAVLCIALSAGGCGAINMWFDRDIDAVMHRTRTRPIPQGRVAPHEAAEIGVMLVLGSFALMGLAANWLAAGLLLAAALFYVFVYTMWLKRMTPQNIVIGGAAGAFPPMIGWAAATGEVGWPAIVLFALIFFWTPPHFWALALYRNDDYRRAGIPMMPVVAGEASTKIQMLVYTLLLLPLALAPYFMGFAGPGYLATAAVLGALFVACAVRVLFDKTHGSARQMFAFSIFYLFALFGVLMVEHIAALWGVS